MDVKELRGQVQDHLNNLYSKAVGKHQKFPYKKVAAGQIRIEGLPEDLLPLQLPSHYGERRLKAFLKCQEFKVQNMDTAVHTDSEYSGMIQDPTNSLILTEFQTTAVSHTILPAVNNISPTTHNFIQKAPIEIPLVSHTILPAVNNISPTNHNFLQKTPIEIPLVSHTNLPGLNNISPTTHNFIQKAPTEIPLVSHTNLPGLNNISPPTHNFIQKAPIEIPLVLHTISPPVQTTSKFTYTAPQSIHESTSTQGTYLEIIKRLRHNQVEQKESHSQWTKAKANPGPPDVYLKRKLEHNNLEVYSVKAIHAQRKRRGIQQYLVEWEGYTMEEATWEPKRNIPEEIINSLWKKSQSISKE